jgi:hypothetical protein
MLGKGSDNSTAKAAESGREPSFTWSRASFLARLRAEVDPECCAPPLVAFSFMAGFMCDIHFLWSWLNTTRLSVVVFRLVPSLCGVGSKPEIYSRYVRELLSFIHADNVVSYLPLWPDCFTVHPGTLT